MKLVVPQAPASNSELRIKIGQRQQVVPNGEYRVKVQDIKQGSFLNRRPCFHFTFTIVEGEYKDSILRGFANAHYESFSSFTKLFKWYTAVTGEEPEPGNEISLDVFFDKVLKVAVEEKRSKSTKNPFSNVTDIRGVVCEL